MPGLGDYPFGFEAEARAGRPAGRVLPVWDPAYAAIKPASLLCRLFRKRKKDQAVPVVKELPGESILIMIGPHGENGPLPGTLWRFSCRAAKIVFLELDTFDIICTVMEVESNDRKTGGACPIE
jgi:hypothetical protein